MAAQGVMPTNAASLLHTFSTSKVKSSKSSESVSFDKMMDRNLKDGYNKTDTNTSSTKPFEVKNSSVEKKSSQTDADGKNSSNQQNQLFKTEQTQLDTTEEGSIEQAGKLLEEVKQIICETLDITEEELVSIIEAMGISMGDLLNQDILKQLVLNVQGGEDASFFLTNEDAAKMVTDLLKQIQDLMDEVKLPKEELKSAVEEFVLQMEAAKENVTENKNTTLNTTGKENLKETTKEETAPKIDVEVVKISEDKNLAKETTKDYSFSEDTSKQSENGGFAEQFIKNLTSQVTKETGTEQQARANQLKEVVDQIVEHIKLSIKPGETSMELQLNPERLGKVNLNLTAKNGIMTAQFTTQNELAKEAIESQMQILKETLTQQGFKIEAIEVTVSDFGFEQNNETNNKEEQQGKSKKRNFIFDTEDIVDNNKESILPQMPDGTGESVDYTA